MNADRATAWLESLREHGYHPSAVLGSGMEGTVIALGDDLVAKVWYRRTLGELAALRTFHSAVTDARPTLATPRIEHIIELDGLYATIEARLRGNALERPLVEDGPPAVDDLSVAAIVDVLGALATIAPTPHMEVLPALEGEPPLVTPSVTFTHGLASLVRRRVERFHASLSAQLPDLDHVTTACVDQLLALAVAPSALVHGDLVPANILVDDAKRPLAVLDFGFLSAVGDPAFDAAITASIYDMYGVRGPTSEAILDEAIAQEFGYDPRRLALYRAAYALITSNCFSVSGRDGHFEWCVAMLKRPDVRAALGS